MTLTVIVPLKALSQAKGRLAGALSPDQRRTFVAWMACRVIAAAHACAAVDRVLVVAGDQDAAAVATAAGADVVVVEQPGLDLALAAADDATRDADATLVLAADLPEATPADVQAVIDAAAGAERVVVVAPTRDGGTGALLRRPGSVITTAYGPGSAQRHQQHAADEGATVVVVKRPALANDVDTPTQLLAALALAASGDVGCADHH